MALAVAQAAEAVALQAVAAEGELQVADCELVQVSQLAAVYYDPVQDVRQVAEYCGLAQDEQLVAECYDPVQDDLHYSSVFPV